MAALQMIREVYGSAEEYAIKECGLSGEQVAQLRKNLIETHDTQ